MSRTKKVTGPVLPAYVEIGPHLYYIHEDEQTFNEMTKKFGEAEGYTDHYRMLISLNPEHGLSQKRSVLLHEIEHCIWRLRGWTTPEGITEEDIVVRFETGLLDMIRRNPDVIRYLQAEHERVAA